MNLQLVTTSEKLDFSGLRPWVLLKGELLCWREVTGKVPQGSTFGPILSNIFINDHGTKSRRVLMKCADESKLRGIINTDGAWNIIQEDLGDLAD